VYCADFVCEAVGCKRSTCSDRSKCSQTAKRFIGSLEGTRANHACSGNQLRGLSYPTDSWVLTLLSGRKIMTFDFGNVLSPGGCLSLSPPNRNSITLSMSWCALKWSFHQDWAITYFRSTSMPAIRLTVSPVRATPRPLSGM